MDAPRYPLQGQHLCALRAILRAPPEVIGPGPGGIRAQFYIQGGEVSGPQLRGRLRPVGGDWFTLWPDGMGELDVRLTIETHDGALVEARYGGLSDFGAQGYSQFLRGHLPIRAALYTTPRFYTAHPDYQWLHRLACVGIGQADLERFEVSYDIYALQ
jgi:hypothetical protein